MPSPGNGAIAALDYNDTERRSVTVTPCPPRDHTRDHLAPYPLRGKLAFVRPHPLDMSPRMT
eukprot:562299-Rhodomonas_salina.4